MKLEIALTTPYFCMGLNFRTLVVLHGGRQFVVKHGCYSISAALGCFVFYDRCA